MDVTHEIAIDLLKPRRNLIHVVQRDGTRKIRLTLLANNLPFDVTSDIDNGDEMLKVVEFRRPDGSGGEYDTTSQNEPAVVREDINALNVWIVSLDGICFELPGEVQLNVRFETESGRVLHTFAIIADVDPDASSSSRPASWDNLSSVSEVKTSVSEVKTSVSEVKTTLATVEDVLKLLYKALRIAAFSDPSVKAILTEVVTLLDDF